MAGACIGILAAAIVVFILVRYLIWIRRWVTEKKLGMTGKLSSRHKPSTINEAGNGAEMVSVHKRSAQASEGG